ncbi:hypothetical protein C0Q70_10315 [Pomacea canaliculata]|uniref:G-protein coupled receptors family 1 profile domain-containing protein n=1 Tax=Pomacea canaliculata TaxID=400727 RepID=A0A2T7PC96_POMCA|nr:hypothetical protein C0Q70_10315 [Pomacea canaliculata]
MIKDMRTPMNWYLVNLSVADLLVLLVCQPAALIEFFARDRWYLGEMLYTLHLTPNSHSSTDVYGFVIRASWDLNREEQGSQEHAQHGSTLMMETRIGSEGCVG